MGVGRQFMERVWYNGEMYLKHIKMREKRTEI